LGLLDARPSTGSGNFPATEHFVQTGFAPLGKRLGVFHLVHAVQRRLPFVSGSARKCLMGGTPSARTWYAMVDGALPNFSAIDTNVSPDLKSSLIFLRSSVLT
jgi:hypothetical protein